MYHRMYLRRSSMSSISEESETGEDDLNHENNNQQQNDLSSKTNVKNCLGDLNLFRHEIREAYQELSTLEDQTRNKTTTSSIHFNINEEYDLDLLLDQLDQFEKRLDERKMLKSEKKKSISPTIIAQFDELDQTLATLTNTLNSVEIELMDSGHSSSSSSATSDSTRAHHQQNECEERLSDSGLSQSTDSISLPLVNQQISNASSILSCDTIKNNFESNQIRLALERIHEANIKKLFVKIHNQDKSTKNILIDETMSIDSILILLFHKYHLKPTLNYAIIEDLTDLHIYRIFEDHQYLINDGLIYWSRDTHNRICFQEYNNKYTIFEEPNKFFSIKDENSNDILSNYISSDAILLPDDITSILHIKDKNRKTWKKRVCVLRQSGIYQISKSSISKRDLVCLIKFDSNMKLYFSSNWTDELNSPTTFGFALKHAHVQKKSTKYIYYLCANTFDEYQRWINGIRIVFYGVQLYKNYQRMKNVVSNGTENLLKLLPNQHNFNYITSMTSSIHQSMSTISLPINRIVSDMSDSNKSLVDIDSTPSKFASYSLDRPKTSKMSFARSSSFYSSLRNSKINKTEQKSLRTKSISPPNTCSYRDDNTNLKRSSSAPRSKSNRSSSSSASIIPFINQCIQPDETPIQMKPPRRPPPPIPPKQSPCFSSHIYDSLPDSPILSNEENRTVSMMRPRPTRVTEL